MARKKGIRRTYFLSDQALQRLSEIQASNNMQPSQVVETLILGTLDLVPRVNCAVCAKCIDDSPGSGVMVPVASILAHVDRWGAVCVGCSRISNVRLPIDIRRLGGTILPEEANQIQSATGS